MRHSYAIQRKDRNPLRCPSAGALMSRLRVLVASRGYLFIMRLIGSLTQLLPHFKKRCTDLRLLDGRSSWGHFTGPWATLTPELLGRAAAQYTQKSFYYGILVL